MPKPRLCPSHQSSRAAVAATAAVLQITSTVPVRTSFYTYSVDWTRIGFEAMLYLCMIFVLFSQVSIVV